MRRLLGLSGLAVTICFPGAGSAQTCNPASFMARSAGSLSDVQQLALLSTMSEGDYNRRSTDASFSGNYAYIYSGSGSYSQKQEAVHTLEKKFQLNRFSDYRKTWAESSLDDNGLAAYKACLIGTGGASVVVTGLDNNSARLDIDWNPGATGGSIATPQLLNPHNISNLNEALAIIGAGRWGRTQTNAQVLLRRQSPRTASDVTVVIGSTSKLIFLPPTSVPRTPHMPEDVSWGGTGGIEETVPAAALDEVVTVKADATAYSRGTGTIWIEVLVDTTNHGRIGKCASEHSQGSYNIGTSYQCRFRMPYDAQKIIISAGNSNADARTVHANFSY